VGLRKPEPAIYKLALEITDRKPQECAFIDDRPLNLDAAQCLGMQTIEKIGADQLRKELEKIGVVV